MILHERWNVSEIKRDVKFILWKIFSAFTDDQEKRRFGKRRENHHVS